MSTNYRFNLSFDPDIKR